MSRRARPFGGPGAVHLHTHFRDRDGNLLSLLPPVAALLVRATWTEA